MPEFSLIQKLIIWALPVLFAITVHEVAHGWMALKCGDRTAQMLGRLTLNPIKHIDPLGTIVIPAILLLLGGFVFGWAKPVPVTYRNLNKPKIDMAWVAIAGPFSNFLMALLWALWAKIGLVLAQNGTAIGEPMMLMGVAGVLINAMVMMLNLLPIPPLDGSRIVASWLPDKLEWQFNRLEPYGFFILIGLIYLGLLGMILWPLVSFFLGLVTASFGLPPELFSILTMAT